MTSAVPSSSSRHRGRRAALTAVLAGALIAGGTVVATVATPAGATPDFQELGTLSLQTRGGVTTATLGSSTQTQTQTFTTTGQCQLSSSGATLLRLSALVDGKAGNVGFQGGTFGVAEKPSGTSCVEVNNNRQAPETLVIKLGGSDVFPLQATTATLDIEAKGTGAVTSVAFFRGGAPVGDPVPINCNATSSDSGPDAKFGDNCVETVVPTNGQRFDELRLSASSGAAISLEGGQDWATSTTPTYKTTFEVGYFGEPPLSCTSSTPEVTGTAGGPTVQITNISVTNGSCVSFRYSLTSGVVANKATATFLKPWSEQSQFLQFLMKLKWPIAATDAAELKPIEFGFHDKDLNPGTARVLGWCPNSSFNLAAGGSPTITAAMDVEPVRADGSDPFPGVQYACMLPNPGIVQDGTGIAWQQSIYVHGDAFARRP